MHNTLELIKFSHSIFALPFALVSYAVLSRESLLRSELLWILICLVTARSAAMAFNRLIDAAIDRKNQRTKDRHIPAGILSTKYVKGLILSTSLLFILSAGMLNSTCLILSPLCLLLLFFYSYTKRFTHFCQLYLGFSLGLAPLATSIALTKSITVSSLLLSGGVLFWVAGFDILYALQDIEFDKKHQLYSLPVWLGKAHSMIVARCFHVIFFIFLVLFGIFENFSIFYWSGLGVIALLLFAQHWIIRQDMKKINAAFFTFNGILSILFAVFVFIDIFFISN